ncbi:hypothetical protein IU448_04030 [Nocardia flavorosea]|uniref:hypothetical protein n=1 Tax=Nocardia flavorosea TaxID=53429 RepID=UPI00189436E0|nr:hypothetical protein [Nocardia flavorosea]MBF6348184.1 hypothetical protein [Nocardia flavorosea]
MTTPDPGAEDPADRDEPDFAEEHARPTHADEHPIDAEIETDESTPKGHSGMDP